jgi:CARDB
MRRLLILATLALPVLGAGPAAAASPAAPAVADKVALSAKVTACTTGADPAARAAAFTASMPALAQTRRMLLRFTLLQRRGATGPFKPVAVPDWGGWKKSDPGRPGFVFTERVQGLLAPAGYRATITFRWVDRRGRVQRELRRSTDVCEQPDPRPDLAFAALDGVPQDKDTAVYTVAVRNDGRSAAGPFGTTVTLGGVVAGPVAFAALAPGATAQATLVAPRCVPGDTVTVTVDAGDAVDERDETDDIVQRPCPLR